MKALLCLLFISLELHAGEDPTGGKAFLPWIWEDQLQPTLSRSLDRTGLLIFGGGAAASAAVRGVDHKIYHSDRGYGKHLMSEHSAEVFSTIGNGFLAVGMATAQYFWDRPNGLAHFRTILLTTTTHLGVSVLASRERPGNRNTSPLPWPSSFPSAHTASAFASAGALAYSYGWKVGLPAYTVAGLVGFSRIRGDYHWASDIVGGAFLGTFWARASFRAKQTQPQTVAFVPVPFRDGFYLSLVKEF